MSTIVTPRAAVPTTPPVETTTDKQIYSNEASPSQEAAAPTPPKEDEDFKKRQALLARHQQRVREEQRRLEEERRTFAKERAELEQARAWRERLKEDPYGVLLEQGLTADQVASKMLNQPNPMDQNMLLLRQHLDQANKKIELLEANQQKAVDVQRESAKKQILHDVKQVVAADSSYEAVRQHGDEAAQAVVDLIEATFDKEGYVMNTDDAIKEVEDYLVEQALKYAQMEKVKQKLIPQSAAQPAQANTTQKTQTMNTLSSRLSPGSSALTDKQRRERAILAFQGKLNPS